MKLLVYSLYTPSSLEYFQSLLAPNIHIEYGNKLPEFPYHILIEGRPDKEFLSASSNLHSLIIPYVGIPLQTRKLLTNFPHISVHNIHHNAIATAEMAITLLLGAAKKLIPIDTVFRSFHWTRADESIWQLSGKTALVLGYGAIGKKIATVCTALGMEIMAIRRTICQEKNIYCLEDLHKLLPRSQALLICLPETKETIGLIGEKEIALLPPQAIIVNVGRGAIVNPKALYNALEQKKLYAAGIDVWYNYPTKENKNVAPAKYPFEKLENIVMSPHRAGWTSDTEKCRVEELARLLNIAARGEKMPNKVDLDLEY